jgi:iron complex transport system substrate-binding protein
VKYTYLLIIFLVTPFAWCSRTVTDELGRTVVVPDHPHRLVCLMPSVVDDVYALGAGADVIAIPDYTKYPVEAKAKPSIGSPIAPSVETIVSMHPDLVLADSNMSYSEPVEHLIKLGIAVFVLAPHGIEGILQSELSLGRALNREQAAQALVARLRAREAAVRQRVNGKPVVSVLMPVGYNPIITIGGPSFISQLIEIAGGRSITNDLKQEWPQISLEAVLSRAPQALILTRGSSAMSMDRIHEQPGWASMPAVKNNRIYYVDDRIGLSSPIVFDALEDLARQLHP